MPRFLIVQLADIGDLILSTPAIAALREAHPGAHIALLATMPAAALLPDHLVDTVILFDKHTFDHPKALLKPANLRKVIALARALWREHCDTAIYFHHFSSRFGAIKFAALTWSSRSTTRIGLENGHGFFLTQRLPDQGFGAEHQVQYWLDLVALVGADKSPRATQVKIDETGAIKLIPTTKSRRIAIHAGGGALGLARRWDAASFAAVADRLAQECGAQIVLVGSTEDNNAAVKAAMHIEPLDLSGQTTLTELAGVLKSCDLFIGADSGVMHIAAAVGTPVVAIFGQTNADAWRPWTSEGKSIVVRSAPECSPCNFVGNEDFLPEGCAERTCMRMVTAEQVVRAAKSILASEPVGARHGVPLQNDARFNKKIHILGLPVSAITYPEWIELIDGWVKSGRPHHVCTINPEMIMIARKDVNFRNILRRADLTVPDGVGLLWAARQIGQPLPERVTGSDGVPLIASEASKRGWRIYLLGAAPGVADKAAEVLKARYPDVKIVGTYSGSPSGAEEDAIVERVNAANPDILFVAYGAPNQDKWIARNLPRLKVKMAMGVGGSLDFVAGLIPRAPMSFQRLGLEWLYRLYLQPRRIGRMMRLPHFMLAVLTEKR